MSAIDRFLGKKRRYVATVTRNDYGDPIWRVWDRQEERYVSVVSTFDAGQAAADARTLEEIADERDS